MNIGRNKIEYKTPTYLIETAENLDMVTLKADCINRGDDKYGELVSILKRNNMYIKRDDMIPYSFGGNKVRMVYKYFDEIDQEKADAVVTYGGSDSNLCRIIANMAAERGINCFIVSPKETAHITYNRKLSRWFGAQIIYCSIDEVSETIDRKMEELKRVGGKPFFIAGGGNGIIGTKACIGCYEEIMQFEKENNCRFDYIFLASGTGTTQSGLVAGKIINGGTETIVGISVARKNPRGRNVVCDAVREFFSSDKAACNKHKDINIDSVIEENTVFLDEYAGNGYGKCNKDIQDIIAFMLKNRGIPMDQTYTGKGFWGMLDYIKKNEIKDKNILFIHTGGTPLFFDYMNNHDIIGEEERN